MISIKIQQIRKDILKIVSGTQYSERIDEYFGKMLNEKDMCEIALERKSVKERWGCRWQKRGSVDGNRTKNNN